VAYGVLAEVRSLAGNPSTAEVPDADITSYIDKADSIINTLTQKNNWTASDDDYEAIQLASNLYAAAMVADHFGDREGKGKAWREEFWRLMKNIRVSSSTAKTNDEGYLLKTAGSET
jgi:hypothetical protein